MKQFRKISANRRMTAVAIGIFLLALSLLFPAAQIRAEGRPIIQVNFKFEGELLDRLSVENRAAIQSRAEEMVCKVAEKRWGFLVWSNSVPSPENVAKWNVTFKVEVRQIPNDSGGRSERTIGILMHSGQLDGNKTLFDQTEGNETIYRLGQLIPFNDTTTLGDDILTQLDRQLGSLFESPAVERYLKQIPIVERVIVERAIVDTDIKRIVVPLRVSDLRTDVDSILRVKFTEPNDSRGRLDLETAGEVLIDGQNKGYVVGWVTELRHSSVELPKPGWGNEQLLSDIGSWRETKVYMIIYSPNLAGGWATENGVSNDPDDGGEMP